MTRRTKKILIALTGLAASLAVSAFWDHVADSQDVALIMSAIMGGMIGAITAGALLLQDY